MNKDKAKKMLAYDEGIRLRPYKDTKGYWTIGIGHFIGERLEQLQLEPQIVYALLDNDIQKHYEDLEDIFGIPFMESLDEVRQLALLNLMFSLGKSKFLGFHNTIKAIEVRDWKKASEGVAKSKWAIDVDPLQSPFRGRDYRVILMLRDGKYPDEYKIGES